MIAPANQSSPERQLLDQALGLLIAALAADEARRCGADEAELAELRSFWVPDADEIIDRAEAMGLLDYDDSNYDEENPYA